MDPQTLPLRDIQLPEAVTWWPLAPGWWLVIALLLAGLAFGVWRWWRWRAAWARRLAQAEFDRLVERFAVSGDTGELAASTATLMRRVCLSYFPRAEVAGLTGRGWLDFLDTAADSWRDTRAVATSPARFASPTGEAWLSAAYRPQTALDGAALIALCEQWLAHLPGVHRDQSRGLRA